jgi:hypothetical protein
MKVILPNKRKRDLIVMIIFAVILAGSGIFLLWRVNQKEELSPEDSSAASCLEADGKTLKRGCIRCQCEDGAWVIGSSDSCYSLCGILGHNKPAPTSGGGCIQGSQCPACEWPNVAYCGCPNDTDPPSRKCGCRAYNNFSCGPACGEISSCTPPSCPSGWTNCGTSGQSGARASGCVAKTSCDGKCLGCQNKFIVRRYCRKSPSNVCDSGEWKTKPSGTYEYCDEVKYSFLAKDSDGIDASSISVKLNDSARASFTQTEQATQTSVSETLSTATSCLPAGSYTLLTSWKDKKGAGGDACTLTTSFEVLEDVLNPDWSISKQAVEKCIDENTENPKAEISYLITVSNTGGGVGNLDKVVDTPDKKVLESLLSNISSSGVFSDGTILWELEGEEEEFATGESKTFSYVVTVEKEKFGEYSNVATAYPKESDSITASAKITADCEITEPEIPVPPEEDLPETGIFDETESSLVLGAILLFLGFTWTWIGQRIFLFAKLMHSLKSWVIESNQNIRSDIQRKKKQKESIKSKQRKEKFEKKVVNKR